VRLDGEESFMHSPLECADYNFFPKSKFSHRRYFNILGRKFFFRYSTNYPFLSGDSFARLVDYAVFGLNGNKKINIKKLSKAKSLFVPGNRLQDFIRDYSDSINARILLTGNSDQNFEEPITVPESVVVWFSQNGTGTDTKWRTLPIGLENKRLGRPSVQRHYGKSFDCEKELKVLVPPMSPTNPDRIQSIYAAKAIPTIFNVVTRSLPENDYFKLVSRHQFVLCCEGNGFDTHRVWETLYLGSFPVLINSPWAQSLNYLKLPFLIVDSLKSITVEMLLNFAQINSDFEVGNSEVLWVPYWKKLFQDT